MFEIIINEICWNIYICDTYDKNLNMIEGEQETQNLGLTNFINGTIHIDKNLSASIFKKILIHEIVHACLFSYGHFNENYSQEELCDIVAFLGPVIFEKASNVLGFFENKN